MNLFITNREIIKNGNIETIREDGREHAGDNLRFGSYSIDDRKFTLFPEPEKDTDLLYSNLSSTNSTTLKGSALFFKQLYDNLIQDEGDVLFFIHGFNTDLNGVRDAFARLHDRYIANSKSPIKHLIIFTWPSRHPIVPYDYVDDKNDAIRSGEALGRCFDKVMNFLITLLKVEGNQPCTRNIHLMAHSMGNRVLKHMLLNLKTKYELFKEIILAAADIEYTIFEPGEAFHDLIDLGYRVHVYFHEKDFVLGISEYTKNFNNRLGKYGRKSIDPTMKDVHDANVTHTADDKDASIELKALNHWYYYSSTDVVDDIIRVLNGENSEFAV